MANDIRVVKSVESSVRDGVTAPELLSTLRIPATASELGAFAPQAEGHGGAALSAQPQQPPAPVAPTSASVPAPQNE